MLLALFPSICFFIPHVSQCQCAPAWTAAVRSQPTCALLLDGRGGNAASLSTPSFVRETASVPEPAHFLSRVQSLRATSYSQAHEGARKRSSARSFREDTRQNRLYMNAPGDEEPQERRLGSLRAMTTLVDNRQGVTKTVCEVVVDGGGECWESENGASSAASGGGNKDDIARDLHSTKQRIEKLNDLVPQDLRANHFTTKAIRLAYLLPGTIMFGFEIALANNLLFQLVVTYLVTANPPPGVSSTDAIAAAYEQFPYSVGKGGDILATSILILFSAEALSIILSVTVGLLIDIWMDGTWCVSAPELYRCFPDSLIQKVQGRAGHQASGQGMAGQGRARQGRAGPAGDQGRVSWHSRAGLGWAGLGDLDRAGHQGRAGYHGWAGQGSAGQGIRAGHVLGWAGPGRVSGQGMAGLGWAEQIRAGLGWAGQDIRHQGRASRLGMAGQSRAELGRVWLGCSDLCCQPASRAGPYLWQQEQKNISGC